MAKKPLNVIGGKVAPSVVIYRKDVGYLPTKLSADQLAYLRRMLEMKCRVRRPDVEALFIPERAGVFSRFHKLYALPQHVIDNRPERLLNWADYGIVIPANNLGRVGKATKGSVDSLNLWIAQNLSTVVDPAEVSVVLEERLDG